MKISTKFQISFHDGEEGIIAASQVQGPRFNPELSSLSVLLSFEYFLTVVSALKKVWNAYISIKLDLNSAYNLILIREENE